MARYWPEELVAMARKVVEAERKGDDRSFVLYLSVAEVTGMDPNDVRDWVHRKAAVTAIPVKARLT